MTLRVIAIWPQCAGHCSKVRTALGPAYWCTGRYKGSRRGKGGFSVSLRI